METIPRTLQVSMTYLIKSFGIQIIYNTTTKGEYDPSVGQVVDTVDPKTIRAYVRSAKVEELSDAVQAGDQIIYFMDGGWVPSNDDTVEVDGVTYKVVSYKSSRIGSTNIMYNVVARRGSY